MLNLSSQTVTVLPMDRYNQALVAAVHPNDWVNPSPADCYDLVVIGAGTAGLVVAAGAAGLGLGLKVALIEANLMGGDCLNVGCVPSKCIIRSSRAVGEIWKAQTLGVQVEGKVEADFPAVMERMRRLRAGISPNDSAQRFQALGIDVFLGKGQFISGNTVAVGEQRLKFKKAVIATGARAARPVIADIETVGFLTNETVFSLTERPQRLAVIGGGPIGCELAQSFRRLGCEVVLLQQGDRLLPKEDPDASAIVQTAFEQEGIQLMLGCKILRADQTSVGKRLHIQHKGGENAITVDEILVGAGRAPNVEGLNLEAAGVAYDLKQGVKVNDALQTSNPKIYGAGDVCMTWKFTHAADAAARIVIKNLFFSPFGLGRSKLSHLVMPWVTYTNPEVAQVGLSEREAKAQGISISTLTIPLTQVDRAIADGETEGFFKIHYRKGSDQIVGATIVAAHAGEMISEVTTAIVGKLGFNTLSSVIHPYPTQAEGIKKAADAYRRSLLTPRTKWLLGIVAKLS